MKFCTHCGNELNENAVICTKCGCAVEGGMFSKTAAEPQRSSFSTISIIGFVLSFVCSIAGLICSVIAYNKAKSESDESSKKFAVAGIIISACALGLALIGLIYVIGILFVAIVALV